MIKDPYTVIKRPVVTEKSTAALESANTYSFEVDRRANKVEIRKAIEQIFEVKVAAVRTFVRKGKPKRVKFSIHQRPEQKFARVRLAEGQMIEALAG